MCFSYPFPSFALLLLAEKGTFPRDLELRPMTVIQVLISRSKVISFESYYLNAQTHHTDWLHYSIRYFIRFCIFGEHTRRWATAHAQESIIGRFILLRLFYNMGTSIFTSSQEQCEVLRLVCVCVCVCVCLSVSLSVYYVYLSTRISQKPHVQTSPNFVKCSFGLGLVSADDNEISTSVFVDNEMYVSHNGHIQIT